MAAKSCLTQVFLFIILKFIHGTVDPPEDLTITDLGHLGHLEIRWSPSQEVVRMKEQGQCLVMYELHYYDSYSSSWTGIRTTMSSFRAQFNLAKEVKIRVYTLISGVCVEGSTVKSKNYTEVVQKPDMAGMDGIQDLTCVYYHMDHLVCSWKRSSKMPAKAQEALYYWHTELAHAKECPHYIIFGGFRSGCNFSGTNLPTFTDVNLCVNVSSDPYTPRLRAMYTTLQIQEIVKPEVPAKVHVEAGADRQLSIQWDSPDGRIPQHCLQWQVEVGGQGLEGKDTLITSKETAVMLPLPDNETSCFRVRSMLNKYCANSGVWSDWSPSVCHPDKQYLALEPSRVMSSEYKCVAVVIIITGLMLVLCVLAVVRLTVETSEEKGGIA